MGKTENKWKSFNDFYVNGVSDGGLIGTANAFVKYLQELLNPDCKLLSSHFIKLLFTENYTNENTATGMCLSWFVGQLHGNKYFTHTGGSGGFYASFVVFIFAAIAMVVTSVLQRQAIPTKRRQLRHGIHRLIEFFSEQLTFFFNLPSFKNEYCKCCSFCGCRATTYRNSV